MPCLVVGIKHRKEHTDQILRVGLCHFSLISVYSSQTMQLQTVIITSHWELRAFLSLNGILYSSTPPPPSYTATIK